MNAKEHNLLQSFEKSIFSTDLIDVKSKRLESLYICMLTVRRLKISDKKGVQKKDKHDVTEAVLVLEQIQIDEKTSLDQRKVEKNVEITEEIKVS